MIIVIGIMNFREIGFFIIFLIIFEFMIGCWSIVVFMINIYEYFMRGIWIIIFDFMKRVGIEEMIIIEVVFGNICLKVVIMCIVIGIVIYCCYVMGIK